MKIRPTTGEDLDVFVDTVHAAFGLFPEPPVDGDGLWWSALETDRCLLAVAADGRPVGTAATHAFELTLPGGALVPAAGVTAVGVLPSHRRRDVLSAMMRRQLADLRDGGEFLSALPASEAPVHGRFGYGPATYTGRLTVPRHRAALAVPRAHAVAYAPAPRLAGGPDDGYLGGTAPSTLVRAGHVRARHPDAAAPAEALFRADRPPHRLHWF